PMANGGITLHGSELTEPTSPDEDCRFSQKPQEIDPDGKCNHDFNCGDYGCGGCVEPDDQTCAEYIEKTNQDYSDRSSDSAKQRAHIEKENQNLKDENQALQSEIDDASLGLSEADANKKRSKIANNSAIVAGNELELQVADELGDSIDQWGYVAHCTICHLTTELDFVTADRAIEVKSNAKLASQDQFTKRMIPTMEACPEVNRDTVELRAGKPKAETPEPFADTKPGRQLTEGLKKSGKPQSEIDGIVKAQERRYLDKASNKVKNDMAATTRNMTQDYSGPINGMGKQFSFKWI
ncbi:MAG: hypothetical protein AAFY56_08040, partial [Pseudomonadota bacterium]